MGFWTKARTVVALLALAIGFSMVAVDFAEARRGGGFGSRGFRTFDAPATTRTAPRESRPIDRSMTPREGTGESRPATAGQPAAAAGAQAGMRRPGMFGGMAGGLLGGLMLGGLVGLLLGHGIGGLAGFLGLLFQLALIGFGVWLVMRLLARRQPQPAGAAAGTPGAGRFDFSGPAAGGAADPVRGDSGIPAAGTAPLGGTRGPAAANAMAPGDEIGVTGRDLDAFERLLHEIQAAFAAEDYAGLRALCTPEIVSYLSEELSQNATRGVRNDVADVKLLQGDLAEAWREGSEEYATVAMRYESVDVMRDRETGETVEGNETPTVTTEVWTFVRPVGGDWKLSAIQDA